MTEVKEIVLIWISRDNWCEMTGYDFWRKEPKLDKNKSEFHTKESKMPFIRWAQMDFELRWPNLKIAEGEKIRVKMIQTKQGLLLQATR